MKNNSYLVLMMLYILSVGKLHAAAYGGMVPEPSLTAGHLYGAASQAASSMASKAGAVASYMVPESMTDAISNYNNSTPIEVPVDVGPSAAVAISDVGSSSLSLIGNSLYNAGIGAYQGVSTVGSYLAQQYQGLSDTSKSVALGAGATAGLAATLYGGHKLYQQRIAAQQLQFRTQNELSLRGKELYQKEIDYAVQVLKIEKIRLDQIVSDYLNANNDIYVKMTALVPTVIKIIHDIESILARVDLSEKERVDLRRIFADNYKYLSDLQNNLRIIEKGFDELLQNIRNRINNLEQRPIEMREVGYRGGRLELQYVLAPVETIERIKNNMQLVYQKLPIDSITVNAIKRAHKIK